MSDYLLNRLIEEGKDYVYEQPRDTFDDGYHVFDTESKLLRMGRMHIDKSKSDLIFSAAMNYLTETEALLYKEAQTNPVKQKEMLGLARSYIIKHPEMLEYSNDCEVMLKRLNNALFEGYVLQPLIDNPDVSDIKVTAYNDIRVRIKGKAYVSNAQFLNKRDMENFIYSIGLRNRRDIFDRPFTRFVDKFDQNYRLRFSITMPQILQGSSPVMHVRKISKKKVEMNELIQRDMLPPVVKEYLIDKTKSARCVVFGGPPGSGKTTLLNAWIEYIPKGEECLCIQENDELFTEQRGWIFKTPDITYDNYGVPHGVTMDALGQMALVEGANRFIVGEVKGAEMRSVVTLVNSGCSSALTMHAHSAREMLPKLADLTSAGSGFSLETSKSMVGSIDVLVFMQGYKVREILENVGYNRNIDDFTYKTIYKYE